MVARKACDVSDQLQAQGIRQFNCCAVVVPIELALAGYRQNERGSKEVIKGTAYYWQLGKKIQGRQTGKPASRRDLASKKYKETKS